MYKRAKKMPKSTKNRIIAFLGVIVLLSIILGTRGIASDKKLVSEPIEETTTNDNQDKDKEDIQDKENQGNQGTKAEDIKDTKKEDVPQLAVVGGGKFPTTDTFTSLGGDYTLKYILKNYNVFSLKDITASHIVGPIVTKDKANKTDKSSSLTAADIAKGKPSYVGKLEPCTSDYGLDKPTVKFDYGFENTTPGFIVPNFYTTLSSVNLSYEGQKYWVYSQDGKKFLNPNNSGMGKILQNDDFINFTNAQNQIMAESINLTKIPSREVSPDPNTGYLRLEAGSNYTIKDASRLRVVDIVYPSGFGPLKKRYQFPTFINIVDDNLFTSGQSFAAVSVVSQEDGTSNWIASKTFGKIAGEIHQYFPEILINGKTFNGALGTGLGYEYGEDNNIIWNLPNIKTNSGYKVALQGASDIPGHIIAPQAQFFNYEDSNGQIRWRGGNLNGCAIVESWYGGNMEIHFWPYAYSDLDKPIFKGFYIKGKKIYDGNALNGEDFKFKLEMFNGGEVPAGIVNTVIPQEVTNSKDGSFNFAPITFYKEGTYEFRIKEVIPEQENKKITYDRSEYKVTVVVQKTPYDFNLIVKYTKVKDSNGNTIDKPPIVNDASFTNKYDYRLPDTGGNGSGSYIVIGIIIMTTAVFFIVKNKRNYGRR